MNIHSHKNQEGVTILLAVMMISAITIIAITVAGFVIQEVKNSRATALTEPAIIAAETASEQGIFEYKRGDLSTPCANATFTPLDGSNATESTMIKKCIATQPTTFQVSAADPLVVYLYDPNDINGNTCMESDVPCPADGNGNQGQIFTSLVVQHKSGAFSATVEIDTLDDVNFVNQNLNPNSTGTYVIPRNIAGSDDERMKITITPLSGTITLVVSTTGVYQGLPDYQTINAEGCVGLLDISNCDGTGETYKRRINVTLPK